MDPQITTALIAAGSALAGAFGGAGLNAWIGKRADNRRLLAEDRRRWLVDRRRVYGHFLTVSSSLLRQMDLTASCLLSSKDDESLDWQTEILDEDGRKYMDRWDDDLQPPLWEVELLSDGKVSDLANRVTDGLLEVLGIIQAHRTYPEYGEASRATSTLIDAMRDAMRQELNLDSNNSTTSASIRDSNWPWLTSPSLRRIESQKSL